MNQLRTSPLRAALIAALWLVTFLALPAASMAQGVTTAAVTGTVKDASGSVVPGVSVTAVHVPSGTRYESVSDADGHFFIPGMRVGGPYTVTAALQGFSNDERKDIMLSLGVTQTVDLALKVASVTATETVVGKVDPVFASNRTGAATAITRDQLAVLPTVSGRMNDITRTTPQFKRVG